MINIFKINFSALCFSLLIFGGLKSRACSPINTPSLINTGIAGGVLYLGWESTTIYNYCAYYIQVELVPAGTSFIGSGPFYTSTIISKTATPQSYPLQGIDISTLACGIYQFRAREYGTGPGSPPYSSWTQTFTVAIPGPGNVPVGITSNATQICAGQSVILTGSGAATYSWNTGATTNTLSVTLSGTTTFTLHGTDDLGCENSTTFTQYVSVCTGIEKQFLNTNEISIYPNPNSGNFTLAGQSDVGLELIDFSGKNIRSVFLTESNSYTVKIDDLSPGIYFVKSIDNISVFKRTISVIK